MRPRLVPPAGDALIGGLLLVYGLWEEWGGADHVRAHYPLQISIMALCTVPLLWRRRWPVEVFVVVITAFGAKALLMDPMSQPLAEPLAFSVALYTVSARLRLRPALLALAYALAWGVVRGTGTTGDGANQVINNAFLVLVFGIGRLVRGLESRATASEEQAQAVQEWAQDWAESSTREAVQHERLRIARELHDIVAHDIGVVMLHAGGGRRMVDHDPAQARAAFDTIERVAGDALAETRRLLHVLRAEHDPLTRQPTVEDLAALADRLRQAGVDVDLTVSGVEEIQPGLGLCLFRIVQEATVNAVRHGHAQHIEVRLSGDPDAVWLDVVDDGTPATDSTTGSGYGVAGMRERVAMFAGTLRLGPRREGGFEVHARLPRGGIT